MKRNFMAILEWKLSNSTICRNWCEGKYENKTPTIGGRFHLKNDLQSFKVHAIKSVGDKKGILDAIKSVGDKKGIPDAIEATLFLN